MNDTPDTPDIDFQVTGSKEAMEEAMKANPDMQVITLDGDMYSMVFGDKDQKNRMGLAGALLGITAPEFGRLRDAWFEAADGELRLAVYTRNGGGNRSAYAAHCALMQAHPWYLTDADDEFDSTYATFRFVIPDEMPARLIPVFEEMGQTWDTALTAMRRMAVPPVDTDDRWKRALEAIRNMDAAEQ